MISVLLLLLSPDSWWYGNKLIVDFSGIMVSVRDDCECPLIIRQQSQCMACSRHIETKIGEKKVDHIGRRGEHQPTATTKICHLYYSENKMARSHKCFQSQGHENRIELSMQAKGGYPVQAEPPQSVYFVIKFFPFS